LFDLRNTLLHIIAGDYHVINVEKEKHSTV
jgi:hypothetical protein